MSTRARTYFKAAAAAFAVLAREPGGAEFRSNAILAEKNAVLAGGTAPELDPHVASLRALLAECPEKSRPSVHAALASTLSARAGLRLRSGRELDLAWKDANEADAQWQLAGEERRTSGGDGAAFAMALHTRAQLAVLLGHAKIAGEAIQAGLAHIAPLRKRAPNNRRFRQLEALLLGQAARLSRGQSAAQKAYTAAIKVRAELVRDFPGHAADAVELSQLESSLADLLFRRGRMGPAKELVQRARARLDGIEERDARRLTACLHSQLARILRRERKPASEVAELVKAGEAAFERLVSEEPGDVEAHRLFGVFLNQEAFDLVEQGEWQEAKRVIRKAIRHQNEALRLSPRYPLAVDTRRNHTLVLVRALDGAGEHQRILEAVEQMLRDLPEHATAYRLATICACRAIVIASKDGELGDAQVTELVEDYGARAVRWMRTAFERGVPADDLLGLQLPRVLAGRDDYEALVAELEGKAK